MEPLQSIIIHEGTLVPFLSKAVPLRELGAQRCPLPPLLHIKESDI